MRLCAFALCLMSALGGCSYYDTASGYAIRNGAEAADRELAAGIWSTCYAATAGALRRQFGDDTARAASWGAFCSSHALAAAIPAPAGQDQ